MSMGRRRKARGSAKNGQFFFTAMSAAFRWRL